MQKLLAAYALTVIEVGSKAASVAAAVDALVEGLDGPSLRDLAGRPLDSNPFEIASLLGSSLNELGFDVSTMTRADATSLVLRDQAQEVRAGNQSLRAFAKWAHNTIGHEGEAPADEAVMLDDEYDLFDAGSRFEPDGSAIIEKLLNDPATAPQRWLVDWTPE